MLHRFLFTPPCWGEKKKVIDEALTEYVTTGVMPTEGQVETMVKHLPTMPRRNSKEQLLLLSTIPNYHWWDYVRVSGSKHCGKTAPSVRQGQQLLYDPNAEANDQMVFIRSHIPTSPRNRLMYFITCPNQYEKTMKKTISKLLECDLSESNVMPDLLYSSDDDDTAEPPPKRRKQGARLVTVQRKEFSDSVGIKLDKLLNSANTNRGLYKSFSEQLVTDGTIQWRSHDDDMDIVVMSDMNPDTGYLKPSNYVHVTSMTDNTGEVLLKCTCAIYKMIQRSEKKKVVNAPEPHFEQSENPEESILASNFTCMHCRFYREHLAKCFESFSQTPNSLTTPEKLVQESLAFMAEPVILLGDVIPNTTTKFSVKGHGSYSVIHISFNQGLCLAKCSQGICGAQMRNKKKIPKAVSLGESDKLCSHLNTLFCNINVLKDYFPDYFQDSSSDSGFDSSEDIVLAQVPEQVNTDNAHLARALKDTSDFDTETGLWKCKALSRHKPKEMLDDVLVR